MRGNDPQVFGETQRVRTMRASLVKNHGVSRLQHRLSHAVGCLRRLQPPHRQRRRYVTLVAPSDTAEAAVPRTNRCESKAHTCGIRLVFSYVCPEPVLANIKDRGRFSMKLAAKKRRFFLPHPSRRIVSAGRRAANSPTDKIVAAADRSRRPALSRQDCHHCAASGPDDDPAGRGFRVRFP